MSDTFQFRSLVICDEIREEVGGKQLIIGAYSGVILVPFVPFYARQLTLRFEIKPTKTTYDHVACTILRPNQSIFYHHDMPYRASYSIFPLAISFVVTGETFEQTGDYNVLLAMDGSPELVGNFTIVTPENLPQTA
jgi:hypothetical protein